MNPCALRLQPEPHARRTADLPHCAPSAHRTPPPITSVCMQTPPPLIAMQNVIAELKMESDMLSRRQREKELMLRQYRIADQQVRARGGGGVACIHM